MAISTTIKGFAKDSALYGVGHILTRAIGFLLLPIHTKYLVPAEYGVAAVLMAYLTLAQVFYNFGLDTAFLRYYVLAESEPEKKRIFSTAFWTIAAVGVVFTVCGVLFAENLSAILVTSSAHKSLLAMCAGVLFFEALAALPFLALRAHGESKKFAALKILAVTLNLALNFYFIVIENRGVEGIFLANLAASAFSFLTVTPLLKEHLRFSFSRPDFRSLLSFGLPYIPATIAIIGMNVADRFLLERMTGAASVGVYNAGFRLAMIMTLLVAAFRFAWHPFFLSAAKKDGAQEKFAKIFTYFLLGAALVFLFITLFLDEMLSIEIGGWRILSEAYWQGAGVVPLIMLGQLLFGVYVNFLVGVYLKEKNKYLPFITGVGLLANIAGNIWLIPIWGIFGAGAATIVGYFIMAAILYFYSRRLYQISYEWGRVLKIIIAAGAATASFFYFEPGFFAKIGVFLLFPAALFVMRFFRPNELALRKSAQE